MGDLYNQAKIYKSKTGHKLSLLFICAGNTCRSATAEAIAKELLNDSAIIKSAGLRIRGPKGDPMKHHAQSILCGSEMCYQDKHFSKDLTEKMIKDASHIFVMDDGLLSELKKKYGHILKNKAKLLCKSDVPDPYFTPKQETTKPLSERRGAYYEMNMTVKKCLIEELNKIFSSDKVFSKSKKGLKLKLRKSKLRKRKPKKNV